MPRTVAEAVAAVDGVADVEVKLVWEPPWSHERMTEDTRLPWTCSVLRTDDSSDMRRGQALIGHSPVSSE